MLNQIVVVILIGTVTIFAAESINEQIEAVGNAAPQERVEIMNRLKLQIANMNEQERSKTLEMLRRGTNHSGMMFQNRFNQSGPHDGTGAMQKNMTTQLPKQQNRP